MINSFTNTIKSFIFSTKSSEPTVRTDRKRKRPYDESSEGDDEVRILSVKKPKIQKPGSTGFFSSSTVQSMSDWVQKKTPSLFNWSSSKNKSVSFQGNGLNGNGEGKQQYRQTSTHHSFSRVDVPSAYRQGQWPVNDRPVQSRQSLSRPPIHASLQQSKQVQTDGDTGLVRVQKSNPRVDQMFRTRNKHRFTAGDSIRLEDKIRYQQLIQKFTTVLLEDEENKSKVNESIRCPVRVPQLPRFYFSSNSSILGSTIQQQQQHPETLQSAVRQKIKVHPKQSTPRPISNGGPVEGDMVQITDISVIPSERTHIQHTETIDLTDDKESDRPEKSRDTQVKSPTADYRESKFLSENWIKELTSTYSAKARETDRKIKEAELRTKILEERRRQDEEDLELKIRQQMHIHKRAPIVIEDEPIEDLIEQIEQEKEGEETLPELTGEMENVINNALSPGNPGEVLVEKFRLQITKSDIATLSGLNWLNDEVINFYMNLLMERGEKEGNPKVYAFNTFFYPKVISGGQAAVKRWTRRVDVLAVDYILVPVHLGMHWCLSVINFKKKEIQYYDSMGGNNTQCLNALKKYLCDESLDKKKTEFNLNGWNTAIVKEIPQQMNGSDCGMFACKFAEYITREAPITFTQEHMPYFRRRMVYEIVRAKLLQ